MGTQLADPQNLFIFEEISEHGVLMFDELFVESFLLLFSNFLAFIKMLLLHFSLICVLFCYSTECLLLENLVISLLREYKTNVLLLGGGEGVEDTPVPALSSFNPFIVSNNF